MLSSKVSFDKYDYLTGEDLGGKPTVYEKTKFEYSPLFFSLSKALKKDGVKSVVKGKSDFNYDSNCIFWVLQKVWLIYRDVNSFCVQKNERF